MFHFISKKPFLKDLIQNDHVDIHSHVLPGIDDGAKTVADSFFLISELQELGVSQLIATPHVMKNVWDNTPESIQAALNHANADFTNLGKILPVKAAAEYLLDANFADQFKNETLLTLKDNHVLVEMSYVNPPIQLFDILFDLQVAGYVPVLAHPERYIFYHHSFGEFEKLKNSGCKFQLNLLSIIGYYGESVAKMAQKLLQKGMIDFVGSDVHHKNHLAGFSKRILFKPMPQLHEAISNNAFFRF